MIEKDTPVVAYYREKVELASVSADISNAYSYVEPVEEEPETTPAADAGTGVDVGTTPDAGAATDAGTTDAGAATDIGTATDGAEGGAAQ